MLVGIETEGPCRRLDHHLSERRVNDQLVRRQGSGKGVKDKKE